jgi:fumarate reductase flavoprotein subunit
MNFDLIAVGGGFAGLTSAVRAAELGLNVAVLERSVGEDYMNNSRVATGVTHVSFLHPDTPPDDIYNQIQTASAGTAREDMARCFADNAGRTLAWLSDHGAEFSNAPHHRVNGPPMLSPRREFKAGLDWEKSGPNLFLNELRRRFEAAGGTMMMGVEGVSLVMTDGACTGVNIKGPSGEDRLDARAVVLADGGYQSNRELVSRYITGNAENLRQRNIQTGMGDGLRMAEDVGAALVGLESFYGHVLSLDAMTSENLWPYPQVDALCAGSVVVDGAARRFADEGLGGIAMVNAIARLDDPLSAVAVFDDQAWEDAKSADIVPPNPALAEAGGTVLEADTLEELAAMAGLDAAALSRTITDYNAAVDQGTFDGSTPPRTTARFPAKPVKAAPFRAIPLCAGITVTMGGIAVDGAARVVRPDDTPISGLYAAGSSVGGIEGGPRSGYVGGLILAFLLGLVAAETAAAAHPG